MKTQTIEFFVLFLFATLIGQASAAEWVEVFTKKPGETNWTYQRSWLEEPGLPPAGEVAAAWVKRNVPVGTQVRISRRTLEPAPLVDSPSPAPTSEATSTAAAVPVPAETGSTTSIAPSTVPTPVTPGATIIYDDDAPRDGTAYQAPTDSAEPGTTVMTLDDYLPLYGIRNDNRAAEDATGILPSPDMIPELRRIWNEQFNLKKRRSDLEEFIESVKDLKEINEKIQESNDTGNKLVERSEELERREQSIQQQQVELQTQITDEASESELERIAERIQALKEQLNKVQDRKDKLNRDTESWKQQRQKIEGERERQRTEIEPATSRGYQYNEDAKKHSENVDQPWFKNAIEQLNRSLGGFGSTPPKK